jgi:AcrR family transcriptional regulator
MSEIKKSLSPLRISPQPTLKIGKSERTRAAILNAALDFIWSHPFRDMTVSSLMASTGVSRAAFYQYFNDLHELMETLLDMLQQEIFDVAKPWLAGVGDPITLLHKTLAGLVHVCYQRGPFLRAITDAATTDTRLEKAWMQFLGGFDDAATARIEADQKQGLIPDFEARPVAFVLNRLDAYTLLQAFGQHPRKQPEPVREALVRVWISTLYGSKWSGNESSDLVRK